MEHLKIQLKLLLKKAFISVSEQQLEQLINYVELLDKWNGAYNLTSIRDKNEMLIKHIMDSLVVSPYLMGQHFIDVGTGPGLPGIPLSILNPEKKFTLLDSLGKKIRFLKQVNYELKLTNVTIVQERVEKYSIDSMFDGIISRAFDSLHNMTSSCRHLINQNGFFYALKGVYPEEELSQLSSDIELIKVIKLEVPDLKGDRHLIRLTTEYCFNCKTILAI